MRSSAFTWVFILLCMIGLVLLQAPLSFSQAQYDTSPQAQTGEQIYGSYFKSDLDTIGTYNGNVSLSIALFSLPGRELPLRVGFTYNSQKWERHTCNDGGIDYACGYYSGGWQLDLSPYGQLPTLLNGNIYWIDGSGTKHRYYSATGITDNQSIPSVDSDGTVFFTGTYFSTGDGSTAYISFKDGSRRYMSVSPAFATANGNTVSTLSNVNGCDAMFTCGLPVQDTLGRTIQVAYAYPSQVLYKITDSNGTLQTYTVQYSSYSDCDPWWESDWFPNWTGCLHTVVHTKITSITLPNGKSYLFEYNTSFNNQLGSLTKVTLPSGAYIKYVYAAPPNGNTSPAGYDQVVQRIVNAADGKGEKTWNYTGYEGAGATATARTVTVTSPIGDKVVHQLNAQGLETQTQWKTGSGNVLKTVTSSWSQQAVLSNSQPQNPQVNTITTILDGGEPSQRTLSYDSNMNLTQEKLTDWQWSATGNATISQKDITYTTIGVPNVTNVIRKSSETLTALDPSTGNFVQQGRTDYVYDEFPFLYTRSGVPNNTLTTNYATAGNLTTIKRYQDASTFLTEHMKYDNVGNVVQKRVPIDANPNNDITTNIYFTDNFCTLDASGNCTNTSGHPTTYAFPTQVTNALNQSTTTQYDYNTGLPTVAVDLRGNSTKTRYDLINRLTSVTEPNGKVTSYSYDDTNLCTMKTVTVNGPSNPGMKATYFDGLYRVIKTATADPENTILVDTNYDDKGRKTQVSNPYRNAGSLSCTLPVASGTDKTTTTYDALDRPTQVQAPDNSTVQYAYSNNQTTVTDEAANQRRYTYNVLGQMTMVEEPNPTLATPVTTTYSYYVFGPLYQSNQSGQTRTFINNWLGQMTSQTLPESGTTTFTYDTVGRLATKLDPRLDGGGFHWKTTFGYDNLGRLTSKSYTDGTPTITIGYDLDPVNPNIAYRGLKTYMQDAVGCVKYVYDSMNRLTQEIRKLGTNTTACSDTGISTSYGYNVKGDLTSLTYPSGRVVNFTYATGGGCCNSRLASVVDQTRNNANVSDSMNYDAAGNLLNYTLGHDVISGNNAAVETFTYNNRLQQTGITAAHSGSTFMNFSYGYGTSATNTGRVLSRTDGIQPEHSANYVYDSIYRLSAVTSADTTSSWGISWTFDFWGDRVAQTPQGLATAKINAQTLGYTNNRLSCPINNPNCYDLAGNQVYDSIHNYTFDAENHLTSMDGGVATYAYDGDGQRMKKVTSTETTYTFYGPGGILSEFTTSNAISGASAASSMDKCFYHTTDKLGSAVLVMISSGTVTTVIENNRTLPYGEMWLAESTPSTNDKKFTTYQRDAESGLDYAQHRYYANANGRFVSPDPAGLASVNLAYPQTWNMYVYVLNDPINFDDPSGQFLGFLGSLFKVIVKAVAYIVSLLSSTGNPGSPNINGIPITLIGGHYISIADAIKIGTAAGISLPTVPELITAGVIVVTVYGTVVAVDKLVDYIHKAEKAKADAAAQALAEEAARKLDQDRHDCLELGWPGDDPTKSPGPGWTWRGNGPVGSDKGAWYNPSTGESLHPDLNHPGDVEPHWDYTGKNGNPFRVYSDGNCERGTDPPRKQGSSLTN